MLKMKKWKDKTEKELRKEARLWATFSILLMLACGALYISSLLMLHTIDQIAAVVLGSLFAFASILNMLMALRIDFELRLRRYVEQKLTSV